MGFLHHLCIPFLQEISLEPKQMKRPLEGIAFTAEESSRWLWLTKDWSWNPSAGEAWSSLSYSGEAFRLRGETLGILRYLLMQKGPAKATLSHQETCIKPKLLEYPLMYVYIYFTYSASMYYHVFVLFTTLYGDPTLCRTPIVYSRVLLLAFHANSLYCPERQT